MSTTAEQKVSELLKKWATHALDCPADNDSIENCDCSAAKTFEAVWEMHHWTITSLAEEAEREAAELRQESKLFNGEVTGLVHRISELKAAAAWLRQKAEEREGSI